MMSPDDIKKIVGKQAATFVTQGMTVGIGTGSTANYFIQALAERIMQGLGCRAVPTSEGTQQLAAKMGVPLLDFNDAVIIDFAVDGADEVSTALNLIKGGGGAMLQEKMIAYAAKRFMVIADESKLVQQLGAFPLPVEVVPYGWKRVARYIEEIGCKQVSLRVRNEKTFITDHGHYILDCHFNTIPDPVALNEKLLVIPGVVETGLFLNMAESALIGYADGTTRLLKPARW